MQAIQEAEKIVYLPMELIDCDPNQPRKTFDPEQLKQLADSIAENGLLEPIIVRAMGDRYQIVAGERRWRAHGLNKAETIKAIIRNVESDAEKAVLTIIENEVRQQVSYSEKAAGYMELCKQHGYSKTADDATNDRAIRGAAKKVSIAPAEMRAYLAFSKLSTIIQSIVDKGHLSFKVACDLAQVPRDKREMLIRQMTKGGLTAAEMAVRVKVLLKKIEQEKFLESLGMNGNQSLMFDAPVTSPATRHAQAQYAADMQTIAAILAKYGDAEGDALTAAMPLLNLDIERERLRIIIATAKRMDNTIMAAQGQREVATIMGK